MAARVLVLDHDQVSRLYAMVTGHCHRMETSGDWPERKLDCSIKSAILDLKVEMDMDAGEAEGAK